MIVCLSTEVHVAVVVQYYTKEIQWISKVDNKTDIRPQIKAKMYFKNATDTR